MCIRWIVELRSPDPLNSRLTCRSRYRRKGEAGLCQRLHLPCPIEARVARSVVQCPHEALFGLLLIPRRRALAQAKKPATKRPNVSPAPGRAKMLGDDRPPQGQHWRAVHKKGEWRFHCVGLFHRGLSIEMATPSRKGRCHRTDQDMRWFCPRRFTRRRPGAFRNGSESGRHLPLDNLGPNGRLFRLCRVRRKECQKTIEIGIRLCG
jgi:hypothetical protein